MTSAGSAIRDRGGNVLREGSDRDRRGGAARRRYVGLAAGVGSAALVYVAATSTASAGAVGLLLFCALLVCLPTAPTLARRVALNGAMVIGWLPLLWWVRWPVSFSHAGLVLAVVYGVAVGVLSASPNPAATARQLLPSVSRVDALVPVGGLLAFLAMVRWAFAGTPRQALALLLPGADNYPHFNMFASIRTYGATLNGLGPAPDGSRWAFFEYPQGFHALAASVSELMHPEVAGPQMLVAYTQAVAAVIVLAVVVMTAALVSIPALRERPGLVVPAATVTWAAFLLEPGQNALVDGFANFMLGAAAAGVALVLALSVPRYLSPQDVVAVGGLLVACAHTWTPLLVLGAPAAVALVVSRPRDAGPLPRGTVAIAVGAALVTSAAVLAAVLLLLRTVPLNYVVTTQTGGLHGTSPIPTLVLLVVALYCCLTYPGGRNSLEAAAPTVTAGRLRAVALTPLVGLVVSCLFLVAQLKLIGTTAYYFLKFVMGFELVMAVLAPAVAALLVAAMVPRLSARAGIAVATVATLLAGLSFAAFAGRDMPLFSSSPEGTAALDTLLPSDVAAGVLAAARGTRGEDTLKIEYFALGRGRASQPFYGDAWFHAVQHSISADVFARYDPWRVPSDDLDRSAALIAATLAKEPGVRVVVDPELVEPLRARIDRPALKARLLPWDWSGFSPAR